MYKPMWMVAPEAKEMVALLEMPSRFALFHVVIYLEFVKYDDKSVVLGSDALGPVLSYLISTYCRHGKMLIVEDEKLRGVIKSNLRVDVFANEDVIRDLMFMDDMLQKIEAADAAVDDARKDVDYFIYCRIHDNLFKIRGYHAVKEVSLRKLKYFEYESYKVQKRRRAEVTEVTIGKREDLAGANSVARKKVKAVEGQRFGDN
uniref:Uncharacterized protein n=1 Tax=Leersia perrieri TaxID=77586 RepID=A0A0D9XXG0_9ORYZ